MQALSSALGLASYSWLSLHFFNHFLTFNKLARIRPLNSNFESRITTHRGWKFTQYWFIFPEGCFVASAWVEREIERIWICLNFNPLLVARDGRKWILRAVFDVGEMQRLQTLILLNRTSANSFVASLNAFLGDKIVQRPTWNRMHHLVYFSFFAK